MELLLLELLLVLLKELLVLLLDYQLLQGQGLGVGLRRAALGQRGRLGPSQRPVLPLQLGHGCCRRHGQAAHALDTNKERPQVTQMLDIVTLSWCKCCHFVLLKAALQ